MLVCLNYHTFAADYQSLKRSSIMFILMVVIFILGYFAGAGTYYLQMQILG